MSEPTSDESAGGAADRRTGKVNAREFRKRLDAVLRQRRPEAMRDFLLDSGQWQAENIPADLERAMWLMIAASPALADLHGEAERWLFGHGYEQEARTILGRSGGGAPGRGAPGRAGAGGGGPVGGRGRGTPPTSQQRGSTGRGRPDRQPRTPPDAGGAPRPARARQRHPVQGHRASQGDPRPPNAPGDRSDGGRGNSERRPR